MKRYQKTIIAVIVLVSVAVGFYFVGYKTAYDRIEESPGSSSIPQTFYATITEINGNNFTVEGLDINDINSVSYTHLDVYKRQILYSLTALRAKTLNAVVIVIPISAQNASNCRFKSASIRMLIFVFAIDSNSFHSYYIHCIIFYLQCQYIFLPVSPSPGS